MVCTFPVGVRSTRIEPSNRTNVCAGFRNFKNGGRIFSERHSFFDFSCESYYMDNALPRTKQKSWYEVHFLVSGRLLRG